ENNTEVVKEGIGCVDEEACMNAEVSGEMMNNVGMENVEKSMRMSNGVFGIRDSSKGQEVGDVDVEEDSVRRDPEVPSDVNSCIHEPFTDCYKDVNDTHDYSAVNEYNSNIESRKKSYADKLSNGYFVRYKIGVNELIYNIRIMWGRHGLKDSVVGANGMCYFKFKHEEGMNYVIDQSPWLLNIPLEAWSVRGISTLDRRFGRPIKMDQVTANMCRAGTGRLGYARVLIEINAADEFFEKIEINYVDEMKKVKSTKWVIMEYTWKPDRCSHCKVFGHSVQRCEAKPKPKPVVNNNIRTSEGITRSAYQEGFVEVRHRRNNNITKKGWKNLNQGSKKQQTRVNMEFRPKEPSVKLVIDKQERTKKGVENLAMERKEKEGSDEEGIYEIKDQATQSFMADEILGNGCGTRVERASCDFNVTLKPEEHSNGASSMSTDMNEFKNVVNKIEVEDLRSNGVYLPYLISDHSPAIMSILRGTTKKKKSCRFANYVADKDGFWSLLMKDGSMKSEDFKCTRKNKGRIKNICCEDGSRVEGDLVNG
ncbi:RNA-directed DNA polymerase, eukaryota, reverse transcriptase zinc-binding domain protein, partial [Tanacetum coccineum]